MAEYICEKCGKKIIDRPSHKRRFCSKKCWYGTNELREIGNKLALTRIGKKPWITGRKHTKETLKKMSLAKKGKPSFFKGKRHSLESRKKMSEALKGHKPNSGSFKKGSSGFTGRHTEETKKKMSMVHTGKPWTEKQRKNTTPKLRRGKNHPNWKGDEVGYTALHDWVKKWLGKAIKCEFCNITKGKIAWANKSGKYKRELNDWITLCYSCHKKYDLERKKYEAKNIFDRFIKS